REGVQSAVGIFLEEIEVGGVVFETIGTEIAEEANAGLLVDEEKTAEVGVELLDAGADGDEIVIGAEVGEVVFTEELLKSEVSVEAIGAVADVWTNDAEFADLEIVEANFGRDANAPVDRLKAGVAVEEIEGNADGLVEEKLFAATEETLAAGLRRAYVAGGREATPFEERFGTAGEAEESLLAKDGRPDGLIALELVAIEGIEPAGARVGILPLLRVAAIVRLLERPTIRDEIEDVADGRKLVGGELGDVVRIGVETVAKDAVGWSQRCGVVGWWRGCAECGLAREARSGRGCDGRREKDLKREDFVGVEGDVGDREWRAIFGFDAELIAARWDWKKAEDALGRCRRAKHLV